tara:strand:+ start:2832 stop:3152 length:321 start_codon:yes stop_codon:yes gene_type:complete
MGDPLSEAWKWGSSELTKLTANDASGQIGQDAFIAGIAGKALTPALGAGLSAIGVGELIPGVDVVMNGLLIAGGLATVLYGAFHKEKAPVQPTTQAPIRVGEQFGT